MKKSNIFQGRVSIMTIIVISLFQHPLLHTGNAEIAHGKGNENHVNASGHIDVNSERKKPMKCQHLVRVAKTTPEMYALTHLGDSEQHTKPSPQQLMTSTVGNDDARASRRVLQLGHLSATCAYSHSPPTSSSPCDVCLSSALFRCSWELFKPFWDQREAALPHRLTVGLPSLRESLASFLS